MKLRDAIKDAKRDLEEYTLMKRMEHFVRKWSPPGRQSEFDMDLFMLVRAIHADSARPYEKTMENVLKSAMPLTNAIFKPIIAKDEGQ